MNTFLLGQHCRLGADSPVQLLSMDLLQEVATLIQAHIDQFEELPLQEPLLRGIFACGFTKPNQLQKLALLPMIRGKNVVVQSATGTGSTVAYAIATLSKVMTLLQSASTKRPLALVLCPTRELAMGAGKLIADLGQFTGCSFTTVVGGTSISDNLTQLSGAEGRDIVTGTPGRVLDLANRLPGVWQTLRLVVLDELDRMTDLGFMRELEDLLLTHFPQDRECGGSAATEVQKCLFFSRQTTAVEQLVLKFVRAPTNILVPPTLDSRLNGVRKYHVCVEREEWKWDTLLDLFETITLTQAVIYFNTSVKLESVATQLALKGWSCSVLTPELTVDQRFEATNSFRSGRTRLLLCTITLARGLEQLPRTMFIYYDLPPTSEDYVLSCARPSRFGWSWFTLLFVTTPEMRRLRGMEEELGTRIDELPTDLAQW